MPADSGNARTGDDANPALALPSFGALLVDLARLFDPPGPDGTGHTWNAALIAESLASRLCPSQRSEIVAAALLRDAGALGLPDHRGARHAAAACWAPDCCTLGDALKEHPRRSALFAASIPGMTEVRPLIALHEECADGSGYPDGHRLEESPLPARIVQFADVAASAVWALRRAGFADERTLVEFLADGEGHETCVGLSEPFEEALLAPTPPWRRVENLVEVVDPLGAPFGDAVGRMLRSFGALGDGACSERTGHSEAVTGGCMQVAEVLGLPARVTTLLKWAALIHDLGESVCRPGAAPDPDHVVRVASLLDRPSNAALSAIVRSHHEQWNGAGFPDGLAGNAIPIAARVIAVVDAFSKAVGPRRNRASAQRAWSEITAAAGRHFDPRVVDAARCWALQETA